MEKSRRDIIKELQADASFPIEVKQRRSWAQLLTEFAYHLPNRLYTIKTEKTATGKVTKVHRLK